LQKNIKSQILDYVKLLFITILVIFIYDGISYNITYQLYTKGTKSVFLVELVIVFILTSIFYFPRLKNQILKYFFPIIPALGLYIVFDLFYLFLLRSPRASDIENIYTVYDFSFLMFISFILFLFSIVGLMIFLVIKAKKFYTLREFTVTIGIRLCILLCFLFCLTTNLFMEYQKNFFKYIEWSQQRTIKNNGKISSFIFFSNLEKTNKKKIKLVKGVDISKTLYYEKVVQKPNIYYVVLESFINPNYLKNIKFNIDPLSNELKKYLYNGEFSKIKSPVYGGNTAQAEFELLTGVKAMAKVSTIDFNIFSGNPINSFLNQLKKHDYTTIAMVATNSGYFNSKAAYKSLGFDKVIFLEEDKSFIKNSDDKRIFDGDLFRYNLKMIKNYLKNSDKPLFNYIVGMYGHFPYDRNLKERPDKVKVSGLKDSNKIQKISNQFYYRTKVLAEYIKEILAIDPDSIIVVSSDHIPPILDNTIKYKYDKYTNIAIMLYKGKPINITGKNQFQIPWIIWDIISEKSNERNISKKTMEKLYFKVLNEGS